jgi:hypothetical protein
MRYRPLLAILALLLAACGVDSGATTTTTSTTTSPPTTIPTTSTTAPSTTTTTPLAEGVLPLALEEMPDTWLETLFIPYGDTPDTLGTHLGGDGEGILFGPEYGAQAPDGSWWFLDVANLRVAHFSEDGDYLDEVIVPESLLVNGIYFQYAFPKVLTDGTVLASRLGGEGTVFLRIRDGEIDSFSIPFEMTPRADDGEILYGFSFDEDSALIAVDPVAETAEEVAWMVGRDGRRFTVAAGAGGLAVQLPDATPAATIDLEFEAAEIGGPVYLMVEPVTGADGTMHLFLLGFPERDERLQLAGYMTISAEGQVGPVEPILDPFTVSDPGTPTRLGVRPGTSDVWYMHIATDGVRVFARR